MHIKKSYPYPPYHVLLFRESLGGSTVISRSQRTCWRRNNQRKPSWKMVQEVQTSQMKKEEVDHKISATRHLWQPWKRTKAWHSECWPRRSMWTIRPSFVVPKCMEIGWMGRPRTLQLQQSRTCSNFHWFLAAKRLNSFPEESCHWGWIVTSLQKRQKKGLSFAGCFTQWNTECKKAMWCVPSYNLAFDDCCFAKKFVEITKWHCASFQPFSNW